MTFVTSAASKVKTHTFGNVTSSVDKQTTDELARLQNHVQRHTDVHQHEHMRNQNEEENKRSSAKSKPVTTNDMVVPIKQLRLKVVSGKFQHRNSRTDTVGCNSSTGAPASRGSGTVKASAAQATHPGACHQLQGGHGVLHDHRGGDRGAIDFPEFVDMFMVNVMQRIITEEEHDRMMFREEIIDEDVAEELHEGNRYRLALLDLFEVEDPVVPLRLLCNLCQPHRRGCRSLQYVRQIVRPDTDSDTDTELDACVSMATYIVDDLHQQHGVGSKQKASRTTALRYRR